MKDINQNNFFMIELIKPNNEIETVYYRKEKERFRGDYAIVKAFSKDPRFSKYTWYGIVNKNFETIIDFKIRNYMEWFPENHLVFSEKKFEKGREQELNFVYRFDNITFHQAYLFRKYHKKISSNIIMIESFGEVYLFDVSKEKILSNGFHQIGEFKEINGRQVAVAIRRLHDKSKINNFYHRTVEVICYIDIEGNIASPVYNPLTNQYELVTKEEFEIFVYELEHKLPDSFNKGEILLNLQKKIKKQKS